MEQEELHCKADCGCEIWKVKDKEKYRIIRNKECKIHKQYILKKDCPKIGKEIGDYYNNEFSESIEELLEKGIIEEETLEE